MEGDGYQQDHMQLTIIHCLLSVVRSVMQVLAGWKAHLES